MFNINVKTENANDGCYFKSFETLGDDARSFIKSYAASFRQFNQSIKCEATIVKNDDTLANARIISC